MIKVSKRKITPDDYMLPGWDQQGEVNYVRGSRYNKLCMTGLWIYYVLFASMFIRGLIIFLNKSQNLAQMAHYK